VRDQSKVRDFNKGTLLYEQYLRLEAQGRIIEADRALRSSIALNEPMAMHALAYKLYNGGEGSIADALELYRRASVLGLEASAWNLARHYDVMQQSEDYFYWLKRSSELGEVNAEAELLDPFPFTVSAATELAERGLAKEALKLYKFASEHGSGTARAALARLGLGAANSATKPSI